VSAAGQAGKRVARSVGAVAREVAVMGRGHIVEYGAVEELFPCPRHACTRSLVAAIPTLAFVEPEAGS
jgi:ABC-type dipeptide/oligopeptide/nickel transport system ATPase component